MLGHLTWGIGVTLGQPFALQGPAVNPDDFQITTFAEGLNYPVGMVELSDGSLLVGVSQGSFTGSNSSLLRLADTDADGIADQQTILAANIPISSMSDVRLVDDLVFVTGQRQPIQIFRLGNRPTDPLANVGEIKLGYTAGGWLHPHSALAAVPSAATDDAVDLYFQVGSDRNFAETTRKVSFEGLGIERTPMNGDSVYRVTIVDTGTELIASDITQIATGLRNAAGLELDELGNLYLQDNGIDGFVDSNEPESADELNFIAAANLATEPIEDFGFPRNYIQYRSDEFLGGEGIVPLVAFQPIGDPLSGDESEGPNDIAFAPPGFPDYLNDGVFVTMHGRFSLGGVRNEENPLVFVDGGENTYFHFIGNDEPDIGHIDGLLSTQDTLYLADISSTGGFSAANNNQGVIYRIQSLVEPGPLADRNADGVIDAADAAMLCQTLTPAGAARGLAESGFLAGDFDLNGHVDFLDFLTLSANFGISTGEADFSRGDADCNAEVEFRDFLTLAETYGQTSPGLSESLATVPEPNGSLLLGVASIAVCSRLLRRSRVTRRSRATRWSRGSRGSRRSHRRDSRHS